MPGLAPTWRSAASPRSRRSPLTPIVRALSIRRRRGRRSPTSGASTPSRRPTLGGVAMFVGFLAGDGRGLALDALPPRVPVVVRAARRRARRRRHLRRRAARRPPRGVGAGQGGGHGVRRQRARRCSASTMFYFRIPFFGLRRAVARPRAAGHGAVGRRAWPTPSTSSTASTAWPPASSPSPPARSSSTRSRLDDAGLLDPSNIGPLVAVIVLGICLGFLPHNFHPARIFMGDAGALLLGLLMAASTIVVGGPHRPSRSAARRTSSSPRCSSRSSSSACRSSTPRSPSSAAATRRARRRDRRQGPPPPPAHAPRATASAAASSSSGPGRRCSRASCCTRPTRSGATPSCRSASPRSAWRCTRSSTPACAEPRRRRDALADGSRARPAAPG